MDYTALKSEILNDPAGLGYAPVVAERIGFIAGLMNQQNGFAMKSISAAQGITWAAAGPYASIYDASVNLSHPCRSSCLAILDVFKADQTIHLELPELQNMFAAWLQTGVITITQHDALIAIAMQPISRSETLGLGNVNYQDVSDALFNADGSAK